MSGTLADAISSNAIVKSFGGENREETRLHRLIAKWKARTGRTWRRATWSGSTQIALLWVVRTSLVGAAIWLWFQGEATPGDVALVLTSYFVVHGYGFQDRHINEAIERAGEKGGQTLTMFVVHPEGREIVRKANPSHGKPLRVPTVLDEVRVLESKRIFKTVLETEDRNTRNLLWDFARGV